MPGIYLSPQYMLAITIVDVVPPVLPTALGPKHYPSCFSLKVNLNSFSFSSFI